jgi:hypothetical protein
LSKHIDLLSNSTMLNDSMESVSETDKEMVKKPRGDNGRLLTTWRDDETQPQPRSTDQEAKRINPTAASPANLQEIKGQEKQRRRPGFGLKLVKI